jgi:dTDP-4-amino-4,6-dideoxygalactose transaminase
MIKLLDPTRLDEEETLALRAAFERVLASGVFILGPEVEALEAECAAVLGCKHAVGVSSGTDALLTSLLALGIGPGHEVIVPSYSFFATAGAVARTGATPVFVDIDLRDFMPSASLIASRIGSAGARFRCARVRS